MKRAAPLFLGIVGALVASAWGQVRAEGVQAATAKELDALEAVLDANAAASLRTLRTGRSGLFVKLDNSGRTALMHASNLLPASCEIKRETPQMRRVAAECFIGRYSALLSNATTASIEYQREAPGGIAGEYSLRFQQVTDGVPVEPGSLKFLFIGRQLRLVSGTVSNPNLFRRRAALSEQTLRSNVGRSGDVAISRTYYDGDSHRFVTEFRIGNKSDATLVRLDEATGQFIEEVAAGHSQGLEGRALTMHAYLYPESDGLSRPSNPYLTSSVSTQGSRTCALGCSTNCDYFIGGPSVGALPDNTKLVVIQPPGAGAETTPSVSAACYVDPWTSSSYDYPSYVFHAQNAQRLITELASMKQHWSSYFNGGQSPFAIELKIQGAPTGGGGGIYTAFDGRISLEVNEPSTTMGTSALAISHEYGHYIHHAYGFGSSGNLGVREGWADSVPLRYAIYRNVSVGDWTSLSYDSSLDALRRYKHSAKEVHGESLVLEDPGVGSGLSYYDPSNNCSSYSCGSIIGQVYWELAFDHCKVGFDVCNQGGEIQRGGLYSGSEWALANSAFVFALDNLGSAADVDGFLDLVDLRYKDFWQTYGYLTESDYERVRSVLGHHCTGTLVDCSTQHRLPDSPLPSAFTRKEYFSEAEAYTGAFSYVQTYMSAGASGGKYIVIPPGGAVRLNFMAFATNYYRLRLVMASGSNNGGTIKVKFGDSGTYSTLTFSGSTDAGWQWWAAPYSWFLTGGIYNIWISNPSGSSSITIDAAILDD